MPEGIPEAVETSVIHVQRVKKVAMAAMAGYDTGSRDL
jgi:hypothetical protein